MLPLPLGVECDHMFALGLVFMQLPSWEIAERNLSAVPWLLHTVPGKRCGDTSLITVWFPQNA